MPHKGLFMPYVIGPKIIGCSALSTLCDAVIATDGVWVAIPATIAWASDEVAV